MINPSLIVLLAFFSLASDTHKTADLITQACAHSPNRGLCRSTLQTAPDGADLEGLTATALKVAMANASGVFQHIAGLLKTPSDSDSYTKQCLKECSDNYQDAMDQIEDSIGALDSRGYDDMLSWIASAMNDADSCEECFRARSGYKSPLTEMNNKFDQLCGVVIETLNLLLERED